ncbi:MAG TPA: TonB-dependent receptor [Bryobacteraceae bacterium]|nr:TonB-dependent receptor [Bryobacteraceae bacterium]
MSWSIAGRFGILFAWTVYAVAQNGAGRASVRGVVHDPEHRPVEGAQVKLDCQSPPFSKTTQSDANGEFAWTNVPPANCSIAVEKQGFETLTQPVVASTEKSEILHLQLEIQGVKQTVEVSGATARLANVASTVQNVVSSQEIAETPGADQTNNLGMITDFTPGAVMVHDMLHMRGGHQVNWFFDDIPVINTSIAANVAPLINPKNVEELQVERGGYSSEYGDRTYGFFNVVTPSGFDLNNEGDLVLSAGNFYSTDDQLSAGGHTQRFAYYASVDGNRSELGLATPTPAVIHDQESGEGGFLSLLYNSGPKDQLRLIASIREDHYQVPNTPDQQDSSIRDINAEQDRLVGFHWTHTFSQGVLFTLSPYYHYNQAHYIGGPNDTPYVLDDNDRSNYFGGRAVLQVQRGRHNASFGADIWGEKDNAYFAVSENPPGSSPGPQALAQTEKHGANSDAFFLEDQYKAVSWLTLDLGLRLTHYSGLLNENAVDPRLGAAIRIPRLRWIVHGYYAYYYQPPPLNSLSGPLLQLAVTQGYGFIPLPGERDVEHDIGLTIPVRGWSVEVDNFHSSAKNFLDHDVLGNSGIFIPLTDLGAIIGGTEVTLRSPRLFHRAEWRVAYSNQTAQGVGPIQGGLLEEAPTSVFWLDHDQRNTLSTVLSLTLPRGFWATPVYNFGSGFLNGDGPGHLAPHSSMDLSIGKHFGENWSVSANAENIGNVRYLLDTSNTFGGTHWVNPRQIYGEVRYRFHF